MGRSRKKSDLGRKKGRCGRKSVLKQKTIKGNVAEALLRDRGWREFVV
jgi:hypothetical protein